MKFVLLGLVYITRYNGFQLHVFSSKRQNFVPFYKGIVFLGMSVCIYSCMHVYLYLYICTHTRSDIYVYVWMCIHTLRIFINLCYIFISWWASGLILYLSYWGLSCNRHGDMHNSFMCLYYFVWGNSQQWAAWLIWQTYFQVLSTLYIFHNDCTG